MYVLCIADCYSRQTAMLSACVAQSFVRPLKLFSFTALECLELAPIPNGTIAYGPDMMANFEMDTVATHTCDDGFAFIPGVGDQTRVCLALGRWSGLIPVCERKSDSLSSEKTTKLCLI